MSDSDHITEAPEDLSNMTFCMEKEVEDDDGAPEKEEPEIMSPPRFDIKRPRKNKLASKTRVKTSELVVCVNALSDKVDKLTKGYDVLLLSYTKMLKKRGKMVESIVALNHRMDKCKDFCVKVHALINKTR